jgi:thiamine pyrophosphokinase
VKAVVVGAGGSVNEAVRSYLVAADLVVAADGGARALLELGIEPALVVGDFDSLDAGCLRRLEEARCRLLKVKAEKDETDMELAVNCALEHGASSITLLGGIGSRLDHTHANFILLARLAKMGKAARAVAPPLTVYATAGNLTIQGSPGDTVSVFPMQGSATGVTEIGFKYKLTDSSLDPFIVTGVSNELCGREGNISVKEGVLLVFHYANWRD